MEILKKNLEKLISTLSTEDRDKLKNHLEDLISVYPFNEYEYIISNLLGLDKIKLGDYLEIRSEYLARNEYLHIYEKYGSPTAFGITWAQSHIHAIIPEMKKPTKKEYPDFDNEYDFFKQFLWLSFIFYKFFNIILIQVKLAFANIPSVLTF